VLSRFVAVPNDSDEIFQPIDPCNYAMDVSRRCGIFETKFWQDSNVTSWVKTFRVPFGTECYPHLHCFTLPDWLPYHVANVIGTGQAGLLEPVLEYSKGELPIFFVPPFHVCGSQSQFVDGSVIATDPPLEFTDWGYSVCY